MKIVREVISQHVYEENKKAEVNTISTSKITIELSGSDIKDFKEIFLYMCGTTPEDRRKEIIDHVLKSL